MVLQFKVTLVDTSPPIWRRFLVPANFTFEKLHLAIQASMGWYNQHLYEFYHPTLKNIKIGQVFEDDDLPEGEVEEARQVPLLRYFNIEKTKMMYIYDFGDTWKHQVVLEKITDDLLLYPICTNGKRACPPEDVGGIHGYYHMLEMLTAPPRHPERRQFQEWLGLKRGETWDDDYFDLEETNQLLQDLFREVSSWGNNENEDLS